MNGRAASAWDYLNIRNDQPWFFSQVDTIDWCHEQLAELGSKLAEEQTATVNDRTINAAFVYFNSRAVATMAAQVSKRIFVYE
jgi:hypothetical protein